MLETGAAFLNRAEMSGNEYDANFDTCKLDLVPVEDWG